MTTQHETSGQDDADYSSVLAAYHRSIVSGTSDEFDAEAEAGLGGAVNCLRMLERQRQLTHSSLDQSTMPTAGRAAPDETTTAETKSPPGRIGRFEIIRKIGSGGSGVVMLARDPELDREMALKIPTPDSLLREEFVERFQREGALAARLKHPHIVSVLENGSIGPICYLATEFCNGPNLHQWFEGKPSVAPQAAAELLRVLASAVQHAHSRGILHRDIKPSNILFELDATRADQQLSEGQLAAAARLADFGLAKNLTDSVNITAPAAILGTPSYMSPEQASADAADVGTHSDVFSLGVILYELLTGISPFKRETALATLQAVRDFRPRGICSLRPDVPADLAAICQKCIEKRPDDRYSSAAALEEDLANFLTNRPVIARPISRTRRSWRWMKRNPWLSGMASLVGLLTILIAVGSSIAAVQLARTQQQAAAEAKNKAAVSDFLSAEIFDQASPFVNPNRELTLLDAIETATHRLEGHFKGQPLVEAEIRLTLGRTYRQLAKFEQAEIHLNRAYELRAKKLGTEHPQTLQVAFERAWVDFDKNDDEAARRAWEEIAEKQRLAVGESHPDTLRTNSYLAYCCAVHRDFDVAEQLFKKTEAAYVRLLGEDHPDTLDCLDNKARMLQYQEKYEEAETLHRRILAARHTALGESHPQYQDSLSELGYVLMTQGKREEAARLLGEAVELRRRTLGQHHPDTIDASWDAAKAFHKLSDFDAAEQLFLATAAAERNRFGVDDARTLLTMRSLASLYKARGQYLEAEGLLSEVLESRRRVLGDHEFTFNGLRRLASIYIYQRRYDEAESLHREMIALATRLYGSDSHQVLEARQELAYGFQQAGRREESEALCHELLGLNEKRHGRDHASTLRSIMRLAFTKYKLRKYSEAETLFRDAWARSPAVRGPTHPETLRAGAQVGKMLIRQGRPDEAEPFVLQALEIRRRVLGHYHVDAIYSLEGLALLREAQGDARGLADAQEQRYDFHKKVNGTTHKNSLTALKDWLDAVAELPAEPQQEAVDEVMRQRLLEVVEEVEEELLTRFADEPEATTELLLGLARLLGQARFLSSAERMMESLIALQAEHFGRNDERTVKSLEAEIEFTFWHAAAHESMERWDEAIVAREKVHRLTESLHGEEHKATADAMGMLARTLGAAGEWQRSFDVHTKELLIRRRPGVQETPPLYAEYLLANDLSELGRDSEAIDLLRENISRWEMLSPTSHRKFAACELLGRLLTRQGAFDEAESVLLSSYEELGNAF